MKRKYLEERFGDYMIFGQSPDGSLVDVESYGGSNSTVARVSKEDAETLVRERDEIIDFMYDLCVAFKKVDEDAFLDFYYNRELPNESTD